MQTTASYILSMNAVLWQYILDLESLAAQDNLSAWGAKHLAFLREELEINRIASLRPVPPQS